MGQSDRKVRRSLALASVAFALGASSAGAEQSRVFVTSTTQNGNLGGLTGGDAICQTRANAASLGGSWVAWLSTSTVDAKDRLTATGPFVRATATGTVIAADVPQLTSGSLSNPISLDENGTSASGAAWTGTTRMGISHPSGSDCAGWTSLSAPFPENRGWFGSPAVATFHWTDSSSVLCTFPSRLYCFEQAAASPVPAASPVSLAVLLLLSLGGLAYLYRRPSAA